MTSNRTPDRVAKGAPTGGQFAAAARRESPATLAPRPRIGGVEVPDGWAPSANRRAHDDFVITRKVGNLTATLWEIAGREGEYQTQTVDDDYMSVGEDRDYWFDDLDDAVEAAEHDLGLHR